MKKIDHWYFVIIEKGKENIVNYGNSEKYTQDEAFEKIKIRRPECRVATKEDLNRLL